MPQPSRLLFYHLPNKSPRLPKMKMGAVFSSRNVYPVLHGSDGSAWRFHFVMAGLVCSGTGGLPMTTIITGVMYTWASQKVYLLNRVSEWPRRRNWDRNITGKAMNDGRAALRREHRYVLPGLKWDRWKEELNKTFMTIGDPQTEKENP